MPLLGPKPYPPELARASFWAQVDKTNGCWLWTGSVNNWGYGRVKTTFTRERGAHRISWELHNGAIPKGLLVLHNCDTPRCVNPAHLRLGTDADNAADKAARLRSNHGVKGNHAKLTEDQVRYVRATYRKTGPNQGNGSRIARELGVGPGVVYAICLGRTWKHVR